MVHGKRAAERSYSRKVGRIMLVAISIFLALMFLLVIGLFTWSIGRPSALLDEKGNPLAGSLSEKIWVEINGVEQGMIIQSRDVANPVLLFLHGGPGMPEYFLTRRYPTGLEDYFTVVWWDQRGAGLSYRPSIPVETMTVEQMVADTLAVTNYLRERFGKDKIFLMGHSGGSFIGIQAAAQAPDLFHAYIGVGQMSNQLASEAAAYKYMLREYRARGNTRMVQKLEDAPPTMTVPLPPAYDAIRDAAMHGLGVGTTREMISVVTGIFVPSWLTPEYTVAEKVNLWRGKIFSSRLLRDTMFATDLTHQVTTLDLPVYFFHGSSDYTCSYDLSRAYFTKINAPLKGFYTFEQSAHSPLFEEPERMREIIMRDVLAGKNSLADPTEKQTP